MEKYTKSEYARALGSIKSKRKTVSSRENGKLGGRPRKPMQIPLTQGKVALVDREDYAELMKHKWFAQKSGRTFYAVRYSYTDKYKKIHTISMHRMLLDSPQNMEVDHVDCNGLNNQRKNLRVCTHAENVRNVVRPVSNTSGFKGVTFHKDSNKWRSQIYINRIAIHIGLFSTAIEAYKAYCEACVKYHGEYANFGKTDLSTSTPQ